MPGRIKVVQMTDICLKAFLMDSGQWISLERVQFMKERAFILGIETCIWNTDPGFLIAFTITAGNLLSLFDSLFPLLESGDIKAYLSGISCGLERQ